MQITFISQDGNTIVNYSNAHFIELIQRGPGQNTIEVNVGGDKGVQIASYNLLKEARLAMQMIASTIVMERSDNEVVKMPTQKEIEESGKTIERDFARIQLYRE